MGRICLMVVAVLMGAVATGEEAVVMIAHRTNPVASISHHELAAIYSGRSERWPDGQKIVAVNQPVNTYARALLYRLLFNSGPWKEFTLPGSPAPFRSTLRQSDRSVTQLVSRLPNAIGYVTLSAVNDRVKIVAIDGLLPGDPGYLLTLSENCADR